MQFFLPLIIYANFSTFSGTLCVAEHISNGICLSTFYDLPKRALFFCSAHRQGVNFNVHKSSKVREIFTK